MDQIPAPDLDRIQLQTLSRQVHDTLQTEIELRTTEAPIQPGWGLVGHY